MFLRPLQILAIAIAWVVASNAWAQDRDAVLRLIPRESHATLVIPNLKALSDQITQCLEGMDRANVLMGARPIDQFKAITGFNVGLNDTGSMAILLTRTDDGSTVPAFIIPVTDADAFIRANLKPAEDGTYTLAGGKTVYARSLSSHVAIAENADAIRAIGAGEQSETLMSIVGERGSAVASQGDVFVLIRKELISGAIAYVNVVAAEQHLPANLAALPLTMASDVEAAVVSVDFDPLGLIVRSFARVKPDSRAAKLLGNGPAAPQSPQLNALPDKPFVAAGAFQFSALGDRSMIGEVLRQAGIEFPAAIVNDVESVQFAAYPSPAGVGGGLLNDAVAVFRTSQPTMVMDSIKQSLLKLQGGPVKREVKWTDPRPINESLTAAAYEVKTIELPPEMIQQQIAEQTLFGRAGFRGYFMQRDDSVIMTFSQRPATLADVVEVAAEFEEQSGLAGQSALRSMRRWLPQSLAFEAYFNVGHLMQFAQAATDAMPLDLENQIPAIDTSLPPIAVGAGPNAGGAEHALVIPSGVLAALFDHAFRQMPGREIPTDEE